MVSETLFFHGVKDRPGRMGGAPLETAPLGPRAGAIAGAESFFDALFEQAGLSITAYRRNALHRRIPACLRFLRVADLAAGQEKLARFPEFLPGIMNVVLLGVTEFCRDRLVFDTIRSVVVPGWAKLQRPFRIWSAACSDGRELYSTAMLLEQAGLLEGAELLGTDCRADAILQARRAVFAAETLSHLDPEWSGHFEHGTGQARVAERLRGRLHWARADLLKSVEPGPWDLILWRNMAIYLEPEAAERVWLALSRELMPGGYLICGKADHPPRNLPLDKLAPCVFRKRFENP